MESLTTSHTGKQAVATPQQTASYLLKFLQVQDFPEAPTSTGCQESFNCKVPTPALTALPSSSLIFLHI